MYAKFGQASIKKTLAPGKKKINLTQTFMSTNNYRIHKNWRRNTQGQNQVNILQEGVAHLSQQTCQINIGAKSG